MGKIFVSHSWADRSLVTPFVETILRLGCGLQPHEITYSSGDDTGVPSGRDLLHDVREKVGDATLVIAVITPSFQTRPVCLAELGAAWAVVDQLFPVLTPGVSRDDLEGVLATLKMGYLDESSTLNELHDRVGDAAGHKSQTATFGSQREKWLAEVPRLVDSLETPVVASVAELEEERDNTRAARAALAEVSAELADLKTRYDELLSAKTAEEARELSVPEDEIDRFEHYRSVFRDRLNDLDQIVATAVKYEVAGIDMPAVVPGDDFYGAAAFAAVDRTELYLDEERSTLSVNDEFPAVQRALEAGRGLEWELRESSDRFREWFLDKYDIPPKVNLPLFEALGL